MQTSLVAVWRFLCLKPPYSRNQRGWIVSRLRCILACSALIVLAGPAHAQGLFDALGIALCRQMPKDDDRLKCYDRIADVMKNATKEPAGTTTALPQGWQIDESKSAIDDSPQVTASLPDKEVSGGLFMRCRERRIDVGVQTARYLGNTGSDGATSVLFRINGDQPVKTTWQGATNGRGVFAAAGFINLLPDNGKLFVRIHDFRNEPHDLMFDLGDVNTPRAKVIAACQRAVPQPRPRADQGASTKQ
jgi:hypothetical protein